MSSGQNNSASIPGRTSSMLDEPIFLCVVDKAASNGSRITEMLRSISKLGRLTTINITDCRNVQIRRLIRSFTSLTEESRPAPIYLVGFGVHCTAVLTATITSPYLVPPSNGGALEDIICGRLSSTEAPAPSKPWLAGIVLIAPPKEIYGLDYLGSGSDGGGLDIAARRCSFLLVVSSKHQAEANAFREALISARRRPTPASVHGGSAAAFRGMEFKSPCEFDLRMLVIGGSDHLLRMHPATLQRFATTQGAIDQAIIVSFSIPCFCSYFHLSVSHFLSFQQTAIKNLVVVSRTLVNATPGAGTSNLESAGVRSNSAARSLWISNTPQEGRGVGESTGFPRRASILRSDAYSRNFLERQPFSPTRIPRQGPSSVYSRDRLAHPSS